MDRVRVEGIGVTPFTLVRLKLRDRRQGTKPLLTWCFQRHLECILYSRDDSAGSSGAIWKLLQQTGLGRTSFFVNKSCVTSNQVTPAEFAAIMTVFKHSLPYAEPSSINRCRGFTLIPIASAAALARTYGRSPSSLALLRSLGQVVPEAWVQQEQQEVNDRAGEVDLVLNEEIESAGFEAEEQSFASELVTNMGTFETCEEDEGKMRNYALSPVPQQLSRELQSFIAYRTSTFQAKRSGAAVVSISAESDTKSLCMQPLKPPHAACVQRCRTSCFGLCGRLRFYGWLKRTDRVPEACDLKILLLARADLADFAQDYATFLRETHELRFSSCANYMNGTPCGASHNWCATLCLWSR